jgi:DNA-binding transcriptional ArsR family regulator
MSDDEWDEIGFIISSDYRVTALKRLADGPATPSQIASEADIGIAHVSRALKGLRDRGLVELLVPEDRKKGRVYGVTSEGAEIWNQIESQNLVD